MEQLNDPKFKKITTQFFWESFFGIFIFGIPAFTAMFFGKMIDKNLGTGRTWTLILLLLAFISSWVMVWFRNKRVTRMYREFREEQKRSQVKNVSSDVDIK